MELGYSQEYELFRQDVRLFLEREWSTAQHEEIEPARFRKAAIEQGYLYRGVPRQYGGAEQPPDVLKAEIIREEFRRIKAPVEVRGAGVTLVIPTLLEWGTEDQKQRFIPNTVSGEYRWAQGYSEPSAGSDLASLRTRAELVGNQWVINGQKVWSTLAHKCQYMFALVRTEPDTGRGGISYLLLDLAQPGITVRPLRQMTGKSEFCEVFFEDAVTPADWIVGERGNGWAVSKSTLKHERSSISGLTWIESMFKDLVRLAAETQIDGRPALENPGLRRKMASLEGELLAFTYSTYRSISMSARDKDVGQFSVMPKLVSTNLAQRIALIASELIGEDMLAPAQGSSTAKWVERFMISLSMAIAGGTSNIQRNIIAERGLGLPRDRESGMPQ